MTEYLKIIYVNCGLTSEYESDLRGNEHILSSSDNKACKKFQASAGFEYMKITYELLLEEHCTSVTGVMGANPGQAFFV